MTTMEWLNKQKAKIKKAAEVATEKAARQTHLTMANRIFIEGKNTSESNIGRYNSTDPIYVNPRNSPRKFTPAGKPGSNVKKSKRATRWFASYRDYRAAAGRETAKVNLNLFGLLQSDFVTGFSGNGLVYTSVLKNTINQKKREGLEKRFNAKIFSISKDEQALFSKLSGQEFNKIMTNA